MGMGSQKHVYTIDPNKPVETEADWRYDKLGIREVAPICDRLWQDLELSNITAIQDFSQNACDKVPQEIGMLFIDGNHSYAGQSLDLKLYAPKIKSGGYLATHEWTYPQSWLNTFDALHDYLYDKSDEWIGPFRDKGSSYVLWFIKK
jgi:hypothetical protein